VIGTASPLSVSVSASEEPTTPAPDATEDADAATAPGALPAGYAGTWTGQVRSGSGAVQDVVLTLRAGQSGETLGHTQYTAEGLAGLAGDDGQPVRCLGDQRFVGITANGAVILRDIPGAEQNPTLMGLALCTDGGTTRLRLAAGGRLSLVSEEAAGGHPTGLLTRQP